MKYTTLAVVGCMLAITGAAAQAQTNTPGAPDPNLCSALSPRDCLNGVSSAVTSFAALRVGAVGPEDPREREKKKRQAGIERIHVAAADKVAGLIAPDVGGWGLWAGYGRASFEGRVPVAPYDAKLHSLKLGLDRQLGGGRYVLGAALVVDRLDTTTRFNGGGQDVDATTVVPYLTILVGDAVSIDFNAGYGRSSASQNRIDPLSVPGSPSILRADYDGNRRFGSVTVNGIRGVGNWTFGGRAGYLYTREDQDAYTETGGPSARTVLERNLRLGQVYVGADAGYRFANNLEVYGVGIFRRDVQRNDGSDAGGLPNAVGSTQPADRSEWEWALGMRFFATRAATLGAEWVRTTGRDQFRHHAVNVLLRFEM